MEMYDVKRLILAMAIQAEIDGMKVMNKHRELQGADLVYHEPDFYKKADELRDIAYKHPEQL